MPPAPSTEPAGPTERDPTPRFSDATADIRGELASSETVAAPQPGSVGNAATVASNAPLVAPVARPPALRSSAAFVVADAEEAPARGKLFAWVALAVVALTVIGLLLFRDLHTGTDNPAAAAPSAEPPEPPVAATPHTPARAVESAGKASAEASAKPVVSIASATPTGSAAKSPAPNPRPVPRRTDKPKPGPAPSDSDLLGTRH